MGEIWPKSEFEFTIVFAPDKSLNYTVHAYLDIMGCKERLHLELKGIGIGPTIVPSAQCMNLNRIFATTVHQYEYSVCNKGSSC